MKIYNRGGRTITSKSGPVSPGKWLECPPEEGAKLLKMFPRDLVADAARDSGFPAEVETLRAEVARLTKENNELRAQLAPPADNGDETADSDVVGEVTADEAEEEDTQNDEQAESDESDLAGQAENADKPKKVKKAKKARH